MKKCKLEIDFLFQSDKFFINQIGKNSKNAYNVGPTDVG